MSLAPWLQPIRATAQRAMANATLPHAIIIDSPGGWGEEILAAELAADLLEVATVDGLAHPDFRYVEPEKSVIKVDDIRTLGEFVTGTRQIAPRKVGLISAAETMNVQAANAFLKRLEEPPAGTHLILVTTAIGQLQPTIRSRCQRLTIHGAPYNQVRDWLAGEGATDIDVHLEELGGAPYDVLAAVAARERPLSPVLAAGDNRGLAQLVADQEADRLVCRWLRCVRRIAAGQFDSPHLEALPRRALFDFAEELMWVRRQLMMVGATPQLLMERLLLQWRELVGG